MTALDEFHRLRHRFLNPPAPENLRANPKLRLSAAPSLLQMYELFDGETMWSAWLPGYRICSLAEALQLMESTADSWEWLEEERLQLHPMRGFFPFIQTSAKTSIGPLLDDRSELNNHVFEYDYESGEVRIWASSVTQFLEAFFTLSAKSIDPPTSTEQAISADLYTFSASDIELLSQWPDVVFPVKEEPAKDVSEI